MPDCFSRFLLFDTHIWNNDYDMEVITETCTFVFSFQPYLRHVRFLYFIWSLAAIKPRQIGRNLSVDTISVKSFVQHLASQDEMSGEPERPRMLLDSCLTSESKNDVSVSHIDDRLSFCFPTDARTRLARVFLFNCGKDGQRHTIDC